MCFRNFTVKSTEKRSLVKHKSRWEDNIRMYDTKIGISMRNRIISAYDGNYWIAFVKPASSKRLSKSWS